MDSNFVKPEVTRLRSVHTVAPKYRYRRIALNNITGNSITVDANASQLLELKLPNTVYNLSKSIVSWEEDYPAIAANYTFSHEDVFSLGGQNTYFGTGGGLDICNLNNASNYVKIRRPIDTPLKKLMSHDFLNGLYPSNKPKTGADVAVANLQATPYAAQTTNPYNVAASATSYDAITSYTEHRKLHVSQDAAGAQAATLNVKMSRFRQFQLDNIRDTVFALDKDLYFGNEMYIRFTCPPNAKFGFQSTSASAPGLPANTPLNLSAALTVKNIYLYLAVEQQPDIISGIISKFNSGTLSLQIPYTVCFKNSTTGGAGSANVQIQVNRQYGKKLKRVMHTVWNPTESANTAYDCDNWNGMKVNSYRTLLDSQPLQDFILSCAQPDINGGTIFGHDDWRENKKYCEDSSILNGGVYQHSFFHIDQFYENNKDTTVPEENLDVGLPMMDGNVALTRLWQFEGTQTGNLTHLTYMTFLRDLHCTPAGPVLDAAGPMTSVNMA